MKIVYYNSDSIHPPSPIYKGNKITGYKTTDLTISQVAKKLENRYGILMLFDEYIASRLINYMRKYVFTKSTIDLDIINEWLRSEWREWILGNGTGIITKASVERGGQSFVDTGAYYENMYMQVEFEPKELKILKTMYNIVDRKLLG